MPAAAVLAPRATTATRRCFDASCNWAKSHVDECECQCSGSGHGGAYRQTELCACVTSLASASAEPRSSSQPRPIWSGLLPVTVPS